MVGSVVVVSVLLVVPQYYCLFLFQTCVSCLNSDSCESQAHWKIQVFVVLLIKVIIILNLILIHILIILNLINI